MKIFLSPLLVLMVLANFLYGQEYRRRKQAAVPRSSETTVKPSTVRLEPGYIVGKVIDSETGEGLPGALVKVPGTTFAYLTDDEGGFILRNLPQGIYEIQVSYVSYGVQTVKDLKVNPGKETKVNVSLVGEGTTLSTINVVSSYRATSDAALISVQRNEIHVSDGYSGDMILKESSDLQVNTVLRRMPGISLLEDRYVILRGLYERYNLTTLNGSVLPVTDVERAAFDYGLIPSNLLSQVRLFKTATAEMIPEFSGGEINLNTVDIPDENEFRVSLRGTYNAGTTFRRTYFMPTDFRTLGIFPEARGIPLDQPSPSEVNSYPEDSPERYAFARSLPRSIHQDTVLTPPGYNFNLTWQRRGQIGGRDAGFTAFFNFSRMHTRRDAEIGILADFDPELGYCPYSDSAYALQYVHSTNTTALLNGGVKLGSHGRQSWKNLFSANYENFASQAYGYYISTLDTVQDYTYYFFTPMWMTRNLTYSTQLPGGYRIGKVEWEWNAHYTGMDVYTPVYRAANYADYRDGRGYVYEYYGANYAQIFSGRQAAHVVGARSDWTLPIAFSQKYKAKVKTGVYANFRIRDFRSRLAGHYVQFDEDGPISELTDEQIHVSNIRNIHSDAYIGPGMFTAFDFTSDYHNYYARANNFASYASYEMRFPYRFRVNVGLRYEYFRQNIRLRPVYDETDPNLLSSVKNDLLPSGTLIWSPNEKSNLRAAYSHTLVRPGDRDLTPLPFLNLPFGVYTRGNPNIQRTLSQNFDLRYEFFPSGTELLSVSAFRKHLENPIEQRITRGIIGENLNTYEFSNATNADIVGIEFEMRVNLGRTFKSSFLENFVLYGNATLSKSKVENSGIFDVFKDGRSLQGQSATIINMGIIFQEPKTKIKLGAFYNRAGRRIALVGVGDDVFPSVYELPRNIIDLQISRVFFNKLEIRLDVQDVLNNPIRWVHIYTDRPMFDAFVEGRDRYIRNIKGQVNISFTASYRF